MLPAALFLAEAAVSRPITLADGSVIPMLVKEAASAYFDAYWNQPSPEDRELAAARLVAASIVTEAGQPALTVEQAGRLKPVIRRQMLNQILIVNGFITDPDKAATAAEAEAGAGNA